MLSGDTLSDHARADTNYPPLTGPIAAKERHRMNALFLTIAAICMLMSPYLALGLLVPKLPGIRTRWRAFKLLALCFVVFAIGAVGNALTATPEQRQAQARAVAESRTKAPDAPDESGLNEKQKQTILAAFDAKGFPAPQKLEITHSRLVATFEIDDDALRKMAAIDITTPKEFGSKAVILLRNAEMPLNLVDDYRVTINGPSPGPGLITRIGSARFSEGFRGMGVRIQVKTFGGVAVTSSGAYAVGSSNVSPLQAIPLHPEARATGECESSVWGALD
jgi:hypothetical protein